MLRLDVATFSHLYEGIIFSMLCQILPDVPTPSSSDDRQVIMPSATFPMSSPSQFLSLGVHRRFEIAQEEYCFDISLNEEGASLLINSFEQMFSEKLRSLLKFGAFSTRYKDVFEIRFP